MDIQEIETTANTSTDKARLEILSKLDSVLEDEVIINKNFKYKRVNNNWIKM